MHSVYFISKAVLKLLIYPLAWRRNQEGPPRPQAPTQTVHGHFAERHFAERHFAERHFAERTFCRRTFCRTDVLPNGHFAERTV